MGFVLRLSLVTAGVIALVVGGIIALTISSAMESMRATQRAANNSVALLIRQNIERASFFALAEAEIFARQPGIIQAIADRDRTAIISRLDTTFDYLRTQAGIEVLAFHQTDFRNLVRMHELSRYGDDISQTRPMLVSTMRSLRSHRGLEIGPTGVLALRGVAPVQREQELIGIAEVGLAMPPLLQTVKQLTGAEVAIVLSNAMTRGGVGTEVTVKDATNAALFSALTAASGFRLSREPLHLEVSLEGVRYALVVEPLLDFSGRMIGSVVGALHIDAASRAFNREVLVLLFAGVAGIIVAFSLLWVALMSMLVRPMETLAIHAEKLAAGDEDPKPLEIGGAGAVHRLHAAFLQLTKAASRP